MCTQCKILYVGETMRTLANRFTDHLHCIRCGLDSFSVACFFNPYSLCTINDICVIGVKHAKGNNKDCVIAKNKLSFQLGTVQLAALHSKFDCFCSLLFFLPDYLLQFFTFSTRLLSCSFQVHLCYLTYIFLFFCKQVLM